MAPASQHRKRVFSAVRMPPLALMPSRPPTAPAISSTARHRRTAAGVKARGGLDEFGSGLLDEQAHIDKCRHPAQLQQRRRLDDHLQRRTAAPHRAHPAMPSAHGDQVAGQHRPDVDDHVDLRRARFDGQRGLPRLDRRSDACRTGSPPPQRPTGPAGGSAAASDGHHRRRHAYRIGAELHGLGDRRRSRRPASPRI